VRPPTTTGRTLRGLTVAGREWMAAAAVPARAGTVAVLALAALSLGGGVPVAAAAGVARTPVAAAAGLPRAPVITFAKGAPGRPLPSGFVGLSLEYSAVPAYAGSATAVNPAVVQLIRNLAPGQTPVLRIGGDSTDQTWWPVAGVKPPGVIKYALTPAWMQTTGAFAHALGARLILGVNLAMNRPDLARAEAEAMLAGIGRSSIAEFEIGNEPDVYKLFPEYRNPRGVIEHVRGRGYDFGDYIEQFRAVRRVLPHVPIAGPALGGKAWASNLGPFIASEPRLALITLHLYPLTCTSAAGTPFYPTIANLLSAAASTGLAAGALAPEAVARAHRLAVRVDEINSVTCGGRTGVSNTFASALWALDTAFALDQAGVSGINFHMFPGARYALFSVAGAPGSWSAVVNPEYYGLLMFAEAAPPGSRLVPVSSAPSGHVRVWATVARGKTVRVVLINESSSTRTLVLRAPAGARGPASAELLQAPNLNATTGVSLGGQSFAPSTTTGVIGGTPVSTPVAPVAGKYSVVLPGASAAMLTWTGGSAGGAAPAAGAAR